MGQLIQFDTHAVQRLQKRLGAVEQENQDLIAFAKGHWGAVASIHSAALECVEADSLETLADIVTCRWPEILGIDVAAFAMSTKRSAFAADSSGLRPVEAKFVERCANALPPVKVRTVPAGHPIFGSAASQVRAEALIRLGARRAGLTGILALGQGSPVELRTGHGSELLLFLGRILETTARRVIATA